MYLSLSKSTRSYENCACSILWLIRHGLAILLVLIFFALYKTSQEIWKTMVLSAFIYRRMILPVYAVIWNSQWVIIHLPFPEYYMPWLGIRYIIHNLCPFQYRQHQETASLLHLFSKSPNIDPRCRSKPKLKEWRCKSWLRLWRQGFSRLECLTATQRACDVKGTAHLRVVQGY